MLRDADHALLRHRDGAVALLDQEAVDAAQPKLAGEREPDRAGAGNDDRCGVVFERHLIITHWLR